MRKWLIKFFNWQIILCKNNIAALELLDWFKEFNKNFNDKVASKSSATKTKNN